MTIAYESGIIPTWTLEERLAKARKQLGMTQGEFAAQLRKSERTIAGYERGERVPEYAVLRLWAQVSGVNFGWLETGIAATETSGGGDELRARRDSNSQPSDLVFAQVIAFPRAA